MLSSFIFNFLKKRLRDVAIVGIVISIILLIIFDKTISEQYIFGLLLGILNFIVLTIGTDLLFNLRPMTAKVAQYVFFTLRYLAIAFVIVLYIMHRKANVFAVTGGLLTMHVSILLSEIAKQLHNRKEG